MSPLKHIVNLVINGDHYEVVVESRESLLDVMRQKLSITGPKKGCDQGECGACTVLIDGKPVNSCLTLAVEADSKEILTIEGLANESGLHPLQEAFIKHGAVQCGYCIPGMIMSAKALLDENLNPTEEEIKLAIAGNLCRCTGYVQIIDAIKEAARHLKHITLGEGK